MNKTIWTYENCKEEAKNYSSRSEFFKGNQSAYRVALKNKWLKDYNWFINGKIKWTYEKCYEEASKYSSRKEFQKGNYGAYKAAQRNKWLGKWFNIIGSFKNDHIYSYEFIEFKAVYVGRTVDLSGRDNDHRSRKDTVSSFAKKHNILIPKMKILEEGITVKEGQVKEGIWKDKYEKEGWITLNKVKTGGVGSFASKWTKEKCKEKAKEYSSRKEFQKGNVSAYQAALKNNWLDEFYGERFTWTYEKCYEEAKKYSSKSELRKRNRGAYFSAWRHKWLNDLFPKSL